jgi:hypothetical protein
MALGELVIEDDSGADRMPHALAGYAVQYAHDPERASGQETSGGHPMAAHDDGVKFG